MLLEDNVYPLTGRNYQPVKKKSADKDAEVNKTLAQLPLLKDRLKYLDKQIDFYSRIDSVQIDFSTNPDAHRSQMAAYALVRSVLAEERRALQVAIENAAK